MFSSFVFIFSKLDEISPSFVVIFPKLDEIFPSFVVIFDKLDEISLLFLFIFKEISFLSKYVILTKFSLISSKLKLHIPLRLTRYKYNIIFILL